MLTYKIDVIEELKKAGYSSFRLRKEKLLNESALQYLRDGKPLGPIPLNTICALLNCQPGDIMEYTPDILSNSEEE